MAIGRLHVLTDYHLQQNYNHAELAERAIKGGADVIQFRQKQGFIRDRLHEAERVCEICQARDVPLIVNDYIDIALAVGADGVHLGQLDFPIDAARTVLGPEPVIGATVTRQQQAKRAVTDGADYLGFGPVFPTSSKDSPATVKGLRGLEHTCGTVDIPVIAIGGIGRDNIRSVLDAGAHGAAVMSAVALAADPRAAARDLRSEIDRYFGEDVQTDDATP
jgi:thiamine-phosphate pyrophosphorylase